MKKALSITVLALFGALSLLAINTMNKQTNMFSSRSLLSSDDDDCDMEEVARAVFMAFNNVATDNMEMHYAEDAQRYLNGKLDEGTNGRPLMGDDLTCIHAENKVHYMIEEVVTNGDDTAILTGTFNVDNKRTGLSAVLSFHPGSCKITDERYFFSTTSETFMTWLNDIACRCWPVWEDIGACTMQAPPADMDVVARTGECWDALSSGRAADFADCWAPHHGHNINGENLRGMLDFSDAAVVQAMLQTTDYSHELISVFAEGSDVHTQVRLTSSNARGQGSIVQYMFQHLEFNSAGKITNYVAVFDDAGENEAYRWQMAAPVVHYWETEAADSLGDFSAELGFPSYVSDNFNEPNLAHWSNPGGQYSCFTTVTIHDRVYRTTGSLARNVFADVTVRMTIADALVDAALSISETVAYDRATGMVTVTESSLGAAVATLASVYEVASGRAIAEVKADYPRRFAAVYDREGDLTAAYRQLLSSVPCSGK